MDSDPSGFRFAGAYSSDSTVEENEDIAYKLIRMDEMLPWEFWNYNW